MFGITYAVVIRCENDQEKDLFEMADEASESITAVNKNVIIDLGFYNYEVLEKAEKERREECYLTDKRYEVTENNRSKMGRYAHS